MWHHGCRGRETKFSWRRAEHRFVRVRVRADLRISRLATHVRTILTRVLRQVSRLSVGFFFGQGRPRAPVSAGAVGVPNVFPGPAPFGRHNAVLFCNLVGALETVNVAPRPAAPGLRQAEVIPVVTRSPLIRWPGSIEAVGPMLRTGLGRRVRAVLLDPHALLRSGGLLAILPRCAPLTIMRPVIVFQLLTKNGVVAQTLAPVRLDGIRAGLCSVGCVTFDRHGAVVFVVASRRERLRKRLVILACRVRVVQALDPQPALFHVEVVLLLLHPREVEGLAIGEMRDQEAAGVGSTRAYMCGQQSRHSRLKHALTQRARRRAPGSRPCMSSCRHSTRHRSTTAATGRN